MENFFEIIGTFIVALLIACVIDLVMAVPIMLLWNWLMPLIFHLPELTFWQTFGFCILLILLIPHNTSSRN